MLKTVLFCATLASTLITFTTAQASDEVQRTHIRVAHLSPTAPAVNFTMNDQPTTLSPLEFGTVSDWYDVEPGTHAISFNGEQLTLRRENLEVPAGDWLTITLIGTSVFDIEVVREDYSEIAPGETRIGVFHGIENAPPLDVYANNMVLFQYVNYPNGNDGYVSANLIANFYDLRIEQHTTGATIAVPGNIELLSGYHHLLVVTGTPDNPVVILTSTEPASVQREAHNALIRAAAGAATDAIRLRVAHFASGVVPVDVYLNGERSAIQNLVFTDISAYLELPQQMQMVTVTMVDQPEAVLHMAEIDLIPGTWYTLALIGSTDNNTLTAQIIAEDLSPTDQTRVGVFQAIPGISPVEVTIDDNEAVRLLGYPGSQGDNDGYNMVEVAPGTYDLAVVSATDPDEVIVDLPETTLQGSRSYLLTTIRATPPYTLTYTEITKAAP
jgi:hypothetical protein